MIDETPTAGERRRLVTEQAAAWLLALRRGSLSPAERRDFVDWLRESPVHIAEMLCVSQVDQALEGFKGWAGLPVGEQAPDNVVRLMSEGPRPPPRRRRFLMASRAIAAGLAAGVLAVGGWFALRDPGTIVRTQLAERREMTLADGSVVNIAPLTELHIRFRSDGRSVELLKGHALFDVRPDPRRPFVVDAGVATARALGTSFDVDRTEDAVRVTVVKGRVVVARGDGKSGGGHPHAPARPLRILVTANEQVMVSDRAPPDPVRQVNGTAEAAWARGVLEFDDETVGEVVRRFNLYNIAQIQILDARLAERRISGTFKATDPESFVAFVRATVTDLTSDHSAILLEPRSG